MVYISLSLRKQNSNPDIRTLIALENYLSILVREYPRPIRPVELASKTHRTKAAVSKLRSKLLKLCDERTMALYRGFLLKSDFSVLANLFQMFALTGKHREFLSSQFVKELFESERFYSMVSSLFPLYGQYFSSDDTSFLTGKTLDIVANVNPDELKRIFRLLSSGPTKITTFALGMSFSKILERVHFSINSQEELMKVIILRDKLFYLVRDFLWSRLDTMRIIKTLDLAQKTKYHEVYKNTIDFYLRQYFELTTEPIKQAAKVSGIPVITKFPTVGSAVLVFSSELPKTH